MGRDHGAGPGSDDHRFGDRAQERLQSRFGARAAAVHVRGDDRRRASDLSHGDGGRRGRCRPQGGRSARRRGHRSAQDLHEDHAVAAQAPAGRGVHAPAPRRGPPRQDRCDHGGAGRGRIARAHGGRGPGRGTRPRAVHPGARPVPRRMDAGRSRLGVARFGLRPARRPRGRSDPYGRGAHPGAARNAGAARQPHAAAAPGDGRRTGRRRQRARRSRAAQAHRLARRRPSGVPSRAGAPGSIRAGVQARRRLDRRRFGCGEPAPRAGAVTPRRGRLAGDRWAQPGRGDHRRHTQGRSAAAR